MPKQLTSVIRPYSLVISFREKGIEYVRDVLTALCLTGTMQETTNKAYRNASEKRQRLCRRSNAAKTLRVLMLALALALAVALATRSKVGHRNYNNLGQTRTQSKLRM